MSRSLRAFIAFALLSGSPALLPAEETPKASPDLNALVQRLDAEQFADRQRASDELSRLGSSAFPALEQAAQSESREASQRAVEILKKHFEGDDPATKAAARATLQRLAGDQTSRGGRLADLVLNPPPPPQAVPLVRPRVVRPAVRIAVGNIRVQAPPARFVKRVHMRNENGVKEIEVEENGRKVKVVDDPQEGIRVEVTQKKDGKETTEKYSAKTADALKQKHPEAHKIYEETAKNGGQIQVGGAQPPRLGIPVIPPVAPAPADAAEAKKQRIDETKRLLKVIDFQIESLERGFPNRPDVQRHIENLKEQRKQIQKLQADPR